MAGSRKVRASCFEKSLNSIFSARYAPLASRTPGIQGVLEARGTYLPGILSWLRAPIIPSKVHASCFEKSTCRILGRYTPLASRIPGILFWLRASIIPSKVHASCFEKSRNSDSLLVLREHHPAPKPHLWSQGRFDGALQPHARNNKHNKRCSTHLKRQ